MTREEVRIRREAREARGDTDAFEAAEKRTLENRPYENMRWQVKRGVPKPEWKLPTLEECETLGGLAFQCGDEGPAETIVGDERLAAWWRGYVKARA